MESTFASDSTHHSASERSIVRVADFAQWVEKCQYIGKSGNFPRIPIREKKCMISDFDYILFLGTTNDI